MNKKLIAGFLALSVLAFWIRRKAKPALKTAQNGKTLLWEISGKDIKQPSYFFGTMHLMCAEDFNVSSAVKTVVKLVEQVYLEVDMENAAEILSGFLAEAADEENSLLNSLGAEGYQTIETFFSTHQPSIPFTLFERQPPIMISSGIYEFLLPCEQKNGIEIRLIEEAQNANKPLLGLESIAFQADILASIPYDVQAHELLKTIEHIEKYRESMNEMLQVYRNQDIEKLYLLSTTDEGIAGSFLETLLYQRNQKWAAQFGEIARQRSSLFAVGAGHLGGEKGVLQLLARQGYTIRALEN